MANGEDHDKVVEMAKDIAHIKDSVDRLENGLVRHFENCRTRHSSIDRKLAVHGEKITEIDSKIKTWIKIVLIFGSSIVLGGAASMLFR